VRRRDVSRSEGKAPPRAACGALASWFGVLRLWSLTASTIPVTVGAALAAHDGRFSWRILALTLLSGWLLQTATNLLNTYGDFRSGVDTAGALPTAPQLVTGALEPRAVFAAGIAALFLGAGAGLLVAALSDWRLLLFAAAGVAGAGFYTTGLRYKYAGLGLPAVFLLMGVLMAMASYFAQTRSVTWASFAAALPIACLVGAILHGNDLRDVETDRRAGIKTSSLILGSRQAEPLFVALHVVPYLLLVASVATRTLPSWALLALLALPLSFATLKTCVGGFRAADAARIGKLEGMSAGTHFIFGTLLTIGLSLA